VFVLLCLCSRCIFKDEKFAGADHNAIFSGAGDRDVNTARSPPGAVLPSVPGPSTMALGPGGSTATKNERVTSQPREAVRPASPDDRDQASGPTGINAPPNWPNYGSDGPRNEPSGDGLQSTERFAVNDTGHGASGAVGYATSRFHLF